MLRISSELKAAAERAAEAHSMSTSEFIRMGLEHTITAEDPEFLKGSRALLKSWQQFHKLQSAERKQVELQLRRINERLDKIIS